MLIAIACYSHHFVPQIARSLDGGDFFFPKVGEPFRLVNYVMFIYTHRIHVWYIY